MRTVRLLAFVAIAILGVAACDSSEQALPADEARDALIDRNWIDVWPDSKDDRLHVYRFVPSMGGGVFQDRNVFEGSFELFRFSHSGETIRFNFPGKGESHTTKYRIERVDGPRPFTHRLVLESSPRGPAEYYGWDEGSGASPFELRQP